LSSWGRLHSKIIALFGDFVQCHDDNAVTGLHFSVDNHCVVELADVWLIENVGGVELQSTAFGTRFRLNL